MTASLTQHRVKTHRDVAGIGTPFLSAAEIHGIVRQTARCLHFGAAKHHGRPGTIFLRTHVPTPLGHGPGGGCWVTQWAARPFRGAAGLFAKVAAPFCSLTGDAF